MTDIYIFAAPGRKLSAPELLCPKSFSAVPVAKSVFEVFAFSFGGQVESRQTLAEITVI